MTRTDFEQTLREHEAMVYSIAYGFFNNRAWAEEVAQDVFLRLYEKRTSIRSGKHAEFWLRRAVTHRCIDTLRRHSVRLEVQLEMLPEVPVSPAGRDPLLEDTLRRLVASLPERPRAVVVLRYGEDMDVADIAAVLDMPQSTVRTHLERGLDLLREKAARCMGELKHGPVRKGSR